MRNSHGGFDRAEERYLSRVAILVLGTGPYWTQHSTDLIEKEFDTACQRADSLDSVADLVSGFGELRLVIVDQRHAEDLLERTDRYFAPWPSASVAFAYRQPMVARDLHRRYDDRFGPMGYLSMNAPFEVWLSSLRLLLHREYYLPSDLRATRGAGEPAAIEPIPPGIDPPQTLDPQCAGSAAGDQPSRLASLTQREQEVLRLASAGHSNKMISRRLAISEHTVKLHMHHVYGKLGVSNRTAAASLLYAKAGHSA